MVNIMQMSSLKPSLMRFLKTFLLSVIIYLFHITLFPFLLPLIDLPMSFFWRIDGLLPPLVIFFLIFFSLYILNNWQKLVVMTSYISCAFVLHYVPPVHVIYPPGRHFRFLYGDTLYWQLVEENISRELNILMLFILLTICLCYFARGNRFSISNAS